MTNMIIFMMDTKVKALSLVQNFNAKWCIVFHYKMHSGPAVLGVGQADTGQGPCAAFGCCLSDICVADIHCARITYSSSGEKKPKIRFRNVHAIGEKLLSTLKSPVWSSHFELLNYCVYL